MSKKLSDLKPNARNPRQITDPKLEMLKKSMEEFGDLSGIVDNEQTGNLVGGHQRTKILPPGTDIVITQSYDPPTRCGTVAEGHVVIAGEKFKYRRVRWDEQKELAAMVAANRHGGDWAFPALADIMLELDNANYDLDLVGYEDGEVEKMMTHVSGHDRLLPGQDPGCDEDEVPEHVEPTTKSGDIYLLGNHRLLCGDSTRIDSVETLMNGEKADMVFTDPPYGMSAVSKSCVLSKSYSRGDIMNDDNVNVAKDAYNLCAGLSVPKIVFWGANYYSSSLPDASCWLVWDKNNGQSDQMDCELAWTNFKGVTRQFTQASEKKDRVHPTQKPVSLVEWCLDRWEAKDVLDLFGGSGSTLIACEKTNRRCFMMELDPHYCDVIVARWEKFSCKKATLLKSAV